MNKKLLLLVVIPISVVATTLTMSYYLDECNFKDCIDTTEKKPEELQRKLDYIYNEAPTDFETIENAYVESDGDVKKAIEIVKEQKISQALENRNSLCEQYGGEWSEEFENCVGGGLGFKVSCDDRDEFHEEFIKKYPDRKFPVTFSINTVNGECYSHGMFCDEMGGYSGCMSHEQKGHLRDVCTRVCEFAEFDEDPYE